VVVLFEVPVDLVVLKIVVLDSIVFFEVAVDLVVALDSAVAFVVDLLVIPNKVDVVLEVVFDVNLEVLLLVVSPPVLGLKVKNCVT
tara:strand:- start:1624 stop:1881 length:258 start_codon:yes stop_codon:yes gene_type:complete